MGTQRIDYIDFMRGIAMLLVVFGHCSGVDTIYKVVNSFHMPLFFFVSGMCFHLPGGGYKCYLVKKLRYLMIPQFTLGVLVALEGVVFDVLFARRMTLFDLDYAQGFLFWFLIVLFFDYVILYPFVQCFKTRKSLLLVVLLLFVVFMVVEWNQVVYLQQTLAALFFSICGYLARPFIDRYNLSHYNVKGAGWMLLVVIAILVMNQDPIWMYDNRYGNKLLFLFLSLLGILAISDVSGSLRPQCFLSWVSRNSITIFVTHFFVLRMIRGLLIRLPDSLLMYDNRLVLFLSVLLFELFIVKFVNRFTPFIVGR